MASTNTPKLGDRRPAGVCGECGLRKEQEYRSILTYHDDSYNEWRTDHNCIKELGKAIQALKYRITQVEK